MPRPRQHYLHRERTRHGAIVWYVRRLHGRRIRLQADYDTEAFWQEYRAALAEAAGERPKNVSPKSFRWALERYHADPAWTQLAASTRRQRENIFRGVVATAGDEPLSAITPEAIRAGRDRRVATPHSANNFLKAMRGFCAWAVECGHVAANPATGIKTLKGKNDDIGFMTWPEDDLAKFETRWPIGTRERLAFDLLLYTGLRRGDAVRVGRQHVREGIITIRTEKTGDELFIPILAPLAASIEATKTGDLTFLVTATGQPWVKESFGNWFREKCREAGCPGSAHGLRKAGATRAAEHGATDRQLMALFGWSTGKMANHYTRSADRRRLAEEAVKMLLPARTENENARTSGSGAGMRAKKRKKSGG